RARDEAGTAAASVSDVSAIQALPEPVRTWVPTAFTQAMDDLFLVAVPFLAVGLVIALLMREKPLGGRETTDPAVAEASRRARRHRSPSSADQGPARSAAARCRTLPRPGRHTSDGRRTSSQRSRLGLGVD
ncbi:MAG: hypothetical protein ACRYG2_19260, partial [Janthinobacterium lividum]